MPRDVSKSFPLTRRGFVASAAAAALTGFKALGDTPPCSLTPEQEVGPYYVDYLNIRADITEGKPGVPLRLRIALVDAASCFPLSNAAVDIWHCDALGLYSGFTTNSPDGPGRAGDFRGPGGPPPAWNGVPGGMPPPPPPGFGRGGSGRPAGGPPQARITDDFRFLRGVQITDRNGLVEFNTIYPGWYAGRAIHIHLKVHCDGRSSDAKYAGGHVSHTGQLFFPEKITEDIAKLQPYAKRLGVHRTTQQEDGIFNGQHGARSMLALNRLGPSSNAAGFVATATLAVDPHATPASVGRGD